MLRLSQAWYQKVRYARIYLVLSATDQAKAELGNWPNTYAKRLHKLAKRTLVKRLAGETSVNRWKKFMKLERAGGLKKPFMGVVFIFFKRGASIRRPPSIEEALGLAVLSSFHLILCTDIMWMKYLKIFPFQLKNLNWSFLTFLFFILIATDFCGCHWGRVWQSSFGRNKKANH